MSEWREGCCLLPLPVSVSCPGSVRLFQPDPPSPPPPPRSTVGHRLLLGCWAGGGSYIPHVCIFHYVGQSLGGCLPASLAEPPPPRHVGVGQMVPASLGVGACLFHFAAHPPPPGEATKRPGCCLFLATLTGVAQVASNRLAFSYLARALKVSQQTEEVMKDAAINSMYFVWGMARGVWGVQVGGVGMRVVGSVGLHPATGNGPQM